MTTEQQFSLVFNCYLNLIEEVLKADICDKLTIHRVENCNHCFTEDVEVLTNNGWKFYKDLNRDYDLVANKNLTTNEIVFDAPLDYILNKDVDCDIHTYKNKNIDLSVTDEHRMLIRKNTSNYFYEQSKELYKKDTTELRFQVSGVNLKEDFAISDDLIKLVAWILTDGSITKGKYGPVGFQITQAKEPTKSMIRQLLTDLGISHRESIVNRITTHIDGKALIKPHKILTEFVINKKQTGEAKLLELLNLISDKKALPEWVWELSKRQFDIFLNVIIAANGNVKVPTSASISGTKNMLDQLQTLCVLNNTKANLLQDNRGDYLLSVVFNKAEITFQTKKQLHKTPYKGDTWCLTMPHGNLVVRRNGRVSIQGNSGTFSQVQGTMLEAFIKRIYPTANIGFVRQKDMMAYRVYGDNCIVTTHGKDSKVMAKNMPYFLTPSWETFFTSVFKRWGILDKHIKVFKGDLHRQGMSEHPMFQYYNFKAMSPPSGWVQHNFSTTESIGYALHVLGTKRDDYTYIDKNFDFL